MLNPRRQDPPGSTVIEVDFGAPRQPGPDEPREIQLDDGSVAFEFGEQTAIGSIDPHSEHGANLAEFMDDADLGRLASDLLEAIKADEESNADWREMFAAGVDLLGLKMDTKSWPFEGASAITHPVLADAVVRFNSRAINEFFPAGGPVKGRIVGRETPERAEQMERVIGHMNYELLYHMEEYFPDEDQAYTYLPIAGCAFKKVYDDPELGRPTSRLIYPQDFIVSYTTTSLDTAPRATQRLHYQQHVLKRAMQSGFYRTVTLADPRDRGADRDAITEKTDEVQGRTPSMAEYDDEWTVYEVHTYCDLPGFEDIAVGDDGFEAPTGIALPYIVSIEKDSQQVLAIRRNWRQADTRQKPRRYFVKLPFIRGLGFYDWGYVHLIGGLAKGSTAILNQLIDAGTLANLPAGFKTKGVQFAADDKPLRPGEFRDVEGSGEDLTKALIPLPFKGPNATLAQILGSLVDAAKGVVATADMSPADMPANAPVGTMNMMMEAANQVMSGVFKRLHNAKHVEFKLLHDLFAETLPPVYPYEVPGADRAVFQADYDGRVDIIPVSDPNAASRTQRIAIAQTQLQVASQPGAPQHDMREVYSDFYRAIGVDDVDRLMPPPPEAITADPVTENTTMLAGRPVKPAMPQNHMAHIAAHMAFLQMAMMNPATQATMAQRMPAYQAHLAEHFAMQYTVQVAQMAGIPPEILASGKPLPPEIEARIAVAAAEASQQMAAQMAESMGQGQQSPEMIFAMAEMEKVKQRREEAAMEYDIDRRQLDQDAAKAYGDHALKEAEIEGKREIDLAKVYAQAIGAMSRPVTPPAGAGAPRRAPGQ